MPLECPPKRILIAPRIPEALGGVREYSGIPIVGFNGECSPGDILIHPRWLRVPQTNCTRMMIPHDTLILPLLDEASRNGWCMLLEDPESFMFKTINKLYSDIKRNYEGSWSGTPRIPIRPPPILVNAEVYFNGSIRGTLRKAHRLAGEGADYISLGLKDENLRSEYLRTLRLLSRDYQVFADPGIAIGYEEAYHYGAIGWMSLTCESLGRVPEWMRDTMAFVIIPCRLSRDPQDRANQLTRLAREAVMQGFKKIIVDPVLQPAIRPGALIGLYTAYLLSLRVPHPIMLGLNNVYELIDTDTTGSIGLLVSLAGEAGVSLILVSEESMKSYGAVLEASIATALASLSLKYSTPPKDYPYRLLTSKDKGWP